MQKVIDNQIYYQNKSGGFDLVDTIKPQDLLKDELVISIANRIIEMRNAARELKIAIKQEVNNYFEIIANKYNVKLKDSVKTMSLESYDGKFRFEISTNYRREFNEGIHIAKKILDEYLEEEITTSSDNIKTLVTSAFRVKQGTLDVSSILKLTKIDIKNEKYLKAMQIIKDSLVVTESNPSYRLYIRNDDGTYEYQQVDFSTLI